MSLETLTLLEKNGFTIYKEPKRRIRRKKIRIKYEEIHNPVRMQIINIDFVELNERPECQA